MKRRLFLFILLAVIFISSAQSENTKRYALVIGNGSYSSGALANAKNDATDTAAALREIGFDVILLTNGTLRQMRTAIENFGAKLTDADIGVFYYSGHGMQSEGMNFLIPVNAVLENETDLIYEAINTNHILTKMEGARCATNIVILDACRNNPFKVASRSGARGLGVMNFNKNIESLIVYSTSPGDTASDGTGRNSPFTASLVKRIKNTETDIESVFRDVTADVKKATNGKQIPWRNSSLTRECMLNSSGKTQKIEQPKQIAKDIISNDKPTSSKISDDFVFVQGGTFNMGSNDGYDKKPVHQVTVSSFYMSKYEVTQNKYEKIMGTNPSYFSENPANGEVQAKRPVEQVSWYDALVYCNKLSIAEGLTPCYSINGSTYPSVWGTVPTTDNATWDKSVCNWNANGYRLPTEAEWEYAARGGNKSKGFIYSGTSTIGSVAWYLYNSDSQTHEVGKKAANELGLYDMSGNLWEWCWDWYDYYRYAKDDGVIDPTGSSSGSSRVLRGGSWDDSDSCTVSYRGINLPYSRVNYRGFRVVRSKM